MKEPANPEEVLELHKILRSDPQRYLKIATDWIRENPDNPNAYFDRHQAWMRIGEPMKALDDLTKSIELRPTQSSHGARADVFRHLGEYQRALEEYKKADDLDPAQWEDDAYGLFLQADTHARLGDEPGVMACCSRLPDDFWTPGLHGAPAGDKAAVTERLKIIATEATRTGGRERA